MPNPQFHPHTRRKSCAIVAAALLYASIFLEAKAQENLETHSTADFITWPLAAIIATVTLALTYLRRKKAIESKPVASRTLSSQELTQSFISAIPSLASVANLEVAIAKVTEVLERTDEKHLFWGLLDLGTNVVQIRVPVTYRYHVQLYETWNLELRGNTLLVLAPKLRASQPPAIHTDEMEERTSRGWLRFSPATLRDALHRDLTPTLRQFATDPERMKLVQETCRESVAEFVGRWIDQKKLGGSARRIEIRFADEPRLATSQRQRFLKP